MKSKILCNFGAAIAVALLASSALAGLPLGGMTVAISPDGKTLVAGGDTRTLVILDPATLEVKNRIWVETAITDLSFSKDGASLLVGDSADRVLTYKTADWSKKGALEKRSQMSVAREADVFAALEEDYSNGSSVYFHAVADGAVKGSVRFPKGDRVVGFGLNPAATRLAVIYGEKEDPAEKKVEYKDIPKDLKDAERTSFQQQNDGKMSRVLFVEVPSGKILADQKTFFTTSNCDIFFQDENACVIGQNGAQAMITPEGKVDVFVLPQYGYGCGASPDHKLIVAGGMGQYCLTPNHPIAPVTGTTSRLPGFPEYFKGFATNVEGPVYASTSCYRVMRIARNGNVEKEAPIK